MVTVCRRQILSLVEEAYRRGSLFFLLFGEENVSALHDCRFVAFWLPDEIVRLPVSLSPKLLFISFSLNKLTQALVAIVFEFGLEIFEAVDYILCILGNFLHLFLGVQGTD